MVLATSGCVGVTGPSGGATNGGPVRYLALGDSYTIGTSVGARDRWPNQLVERLAGRVNLELVDNLGVNGFTSTDLIDLELPRVPALEPDFVTLLIGVNDVVQGVPPDAYTANVRHILDTLAAALPPNRIVVVSIPDYTLTPQGAAFGDPAQQRAEIARFNSIMAAETASRSVAFVDITSVADGAGTDSSLVAGDGLHPSGRQYTGWVDLIAPAVQRAFETSSAQ